MRHDVTSFLLIAVSASLCQNPLFTNAQELEDNGMVFLDDQEMEDTGILLVDASKKRCHIFSTIVRCSGLGLKDIPDYIPLNVTVLDLSDNLISEINQNLSRFHSLVELYLSNNFIAKLETDSFEGLDQLLILDLRDNNLTMNDETFPPGIFAALKSLKLLKINRNNINITDPSLSYPDRALSDLKSLVSLHMDGLKNKTFGEGFQTMTSLRNLTLIGKPDGYCAIGNIPNDTFIYLSQLRVLEINRCFVNGSLIGLFAFQPLQKLEVLDLSNDEFIYFKYLGPMLLTMNSTSLTHLIIHNTMSPYFPCVTVTNDFAKSLPRSLKHLVASSNGLAVIESEVFDLLPKNLTYLDLSDNRFTFGSYLKNFSKLMNLETLVLNGAVESYNLPRWYPPDENNYNFHLQPNYPIFSPQWENVSLELPPRLKTIYMNSASMSYKLSKFDVDANNSLENLVLDGNKIQALKGPLSGLGNLKNLSLVDCYIKEINEVFFDNFTSLEFLNLSANTLGGNVLKNGSKPIFKQLKNLKELDLSFVNILTNDVNVFEGLDNLERLHLQRNGMYYFNVNVSHMTKLRYVNFSMTALSTLIPSVTNFFDTISTSNNLSIDFSENPIHCYCINIDFIAWLANALKMKSIHFTRLERFKCVYEDTSEKYFNDFEALHKELNRQCIPHLTLLFTVLAATFLLVSIIAILVIYRFRWKLKYLYYSAYLYFKSNKRFLEDSGAYDFDVFISFANEDERFIHEILVPELKSRGLKVHIHTLDFIAGEFITTNIVKAVQSSRRTLIVLSSNLLKSYWCRFEFEMANIESVNTGRPVMVFLLMPQLHKEEMSRELLYHIKNNTYIELPDNLDDERTVDIFWTKLCSDLKA